METKTTVEGNLAGILSLAKQIRFAAATTSTAIVKEAQRVVIDRIQSTFITRSNWFAPSNYFGIHYKQATVEDQSADLSTNAYWLIPHELGATKQAHDGQFLAIPTADIQPDIRQQIPENLRPRNLAHAFILNTQRGPKLFQRINGRLRMVYNLVRQVHVPKQSTVIEPTIEVVRTRYPIVFTEKLKESLRTAK